MPQLNQMKSPYTIKQSPKGWVIIIRFTKGDQACFLRDPYHEYDGLVDLMLQKDILELTGEKFQNQDKSIYHCVRLDDKERLIHQILKKRYTDTQKAYNFGLELKLRTIFTYYKSLISDRFDEKAIKKCTLKLKRDIKEHGIEYLYHSVLLAA